MKNRNTIFATILVLISCFELLAPKAFGVVPEPDGGYPGFNTAEGANALKNLTTGVGNAAVGWYSLFSNTDGSFNTAVGAGTLLFNVGNQSTGEGISNTAIGTAALLFNTTGSDNIAVGTGALVNNNGNANTALGGSALNANTTGQINTAIGSRALFNNTTGDNNTAIGRNAGFNQTTGSGNVYIGQGITGVAGESDACYIRSIFGQTSGTGVAVLINSDNKLGTLPSSQRFKEQIVPMDDVSEILFSLKPVRFRYNYEIDPARTQQLGLVAEDVEKVNPDLIVRDKEGKPYSVRYDQVNAMLLNEFLKAHRKMGAQEATIARQQKQIETLTAGLQKVSAQLATAGPSRGGLEPSKPAAQIVLNNQ
jgi:Chaperone of endosialidase